jgi:hypothetical protein
MKGTTMTHPASLEGAFGFSQSDLEANRAEMLSERQRALLARQVRQVTLIMVLYLVGVVLVPLGGLLYFAQQGNLPMIGLTIFLLVILPLLAFWLANEERHKWQADLRQGVAASVYGPARLTDITPPRSREKARRRFTLAIGNETFTVNRAQREALTAGTTYCVYYAPRSRLILGVEQPAAE